MTTADQQFQGVYGTYAITDTDRREVRNYRLALLLSGVSMLGVFSTGGSSVRNGPGSGRSHSPSGLAWLCTGFTSI